MAFCQVLSETDSLVISPDLLLCSIFEKFEALWGSALFVCYFDQPHIVRTHSIVSLEC